MFFRIIVRYALYRHLPDGSVFVREPDPHGDHGAVLIVLAYYIYNLLIVSFSHDIPLSSPFLAVLLRKYIMEHLFGYIKG